MRKNAVLVDDLLKHLTGRGACELNGNRLAAVVADHFNGGRSDNVLYLLSDLNLKHVAGIDVYEYGRRGRRCGAV